MYRTRFQSAVVFMILVTSVFVLLSFLPQKKHGRQPKLIRNESDILCVEAHVANLTFPMCLYDSVDDVYISTVVHEGSYYEPELVEKFVEFLKEHPNVTFLDLGANLGTYSLPVAHSGGQVVAIEPNRDTARRLAKSVHLGHIGHRMELLNYAVSNEESITFMKVDITNRGDTFLAGGTSCEDCISAQTTTLNKLIPFIKNRKAILKVDTQEAEIKIFNRHSAGEFFSEVDVLMVQMEWHLYPTRFGDTEIDRRRVDRFLEFFYQRGYEVYDPRTEEKMPPEWTNWPFDIMFKKEGLSTDHLFHI